MGRRLSIHEAGAYFGSLKGRIRAAALRGLQSAGERLVQEAVKTTDELDPKPVDRGIYRAGWRSTKTPDGAFVHNDVPYAEIIERGARAKNIKIGRLMIEALAQWVMRKGMVARGRGASGKEAALAEARSIAWAIARKMQQRGIFNRDGQEGLHVLAKASKHLKLFVREEVKREIEREGRH